jgi:hypothetical protein
LGVGHPCIDVQRILSAVFAPVPIVLFASFYIIYHSLQPSDYSMSISVFLSIAYNDDQLPFVFEDCLQFSLDIRQVQYELALKSRIEQKKEKLCFRFLCLGLARARDRTSV